MRQYLGKPFRIVPLLSLALIAAFCLNGCNSTHQARTFATSQQTGTADVGKGVQPHHIVAKSTDKPRITRKSSSPVVSTNSIVINGNIDPNAPVMNSGAQVATAAPSGTFLGWLRSLPQSLTEDTPTARLKLAGIFVLLLFPATLLIVVRIRKAKAIVEPYLRPQG